MTEPRPGLVTLNRCLVSQVLAQASRGLAHAQPVPLKWVLGPGVVWGSKKVSSGTTVQQVPLKRVNPQSERIRSGSKATLHRNEQSANERLLLKLKLRVLRRCLQVRTQR